MGRDPREEIQLHEAIELALGEFVFPAEGFQQREVEEFGSRDADADAFGGRFGVEGCLELYLAEGAVLEEARVVAVIAQVVEGFVGVFDGDFGAGGVGEEGRCHGVVEVGAVGVRLVGRED